MSKICFNSLNLSKLVSIKKYPHKKYIYKKYFMSEIIVIKTLVGKVEVVFHDQQIEKINLNSSKKLCAPHSDFAKSFCQQLTNYFQQQSNGFNWQVLSQGTDYQRRVWKALCDIPVGTVITYGELSNKLKSSPRAVGNACRRNPTPIIVPCHRVVSATGLGGFAGETEGELLTIKKKLLSLEGVVI